MAGDKTFKDRTFDRWRALVQTREPYMQDWRELSDFVLGSRGRFLLETSQKNTDRRNPRLYNETAKVAARTLMSGMMAGITSPARPWYKLGSGDPDLDEFEPVKMWLRDVEKVMYRIFAKSNFYSTMSANHLEIGTFGTHAISGIADFDTVMRFEPYTAGSYCLAMDGKRRVDTFYRQYDLPVHEVAKRFGDKTASHPLHMFSQTVKNLWDRGQYEDKVKILHAIEPNFDRKFDSPLARDMPWRSVYFEVSRGGGDRSSAPFKFSGFEQRPFFAPRWTTVDDEVYAAAYPGIDSLASNKSLQVDELDRALAVEKMHNPPLLGDSVLQNGNVDLIAGGISFMPNLMQAAKPGLAPVYDVNPRVAELDQGIQIKEQRVEKFYYADLFMMISELDRSGITATEIAERKEEKLLMLGPVLEALNNELLDPVIDLTFAKAQEAGILPPPPPDIEGKDLDVEYISILAQAQKAVSTASMESTVMFAASMAPVWPEARHKVDAMQAIDEYARAKGAPPSMIRSDDDAEAASADEQRQMQMAQMAEMAPGLAKAATDAASTEVVDNNVQDQLSEALSGVAA